MGQFWPAGMLRRDPLTEGLYETSLEILYQNWKELDKHKISLSWRIIQNRKYGNTSFT